ncbi:hypothetical protein VNI00_013243 [Paramarasmius palmivorus]|uniref:Uncharacterized protein n=1 Tax=Paramarasmius palmivorus TaxID=297713 RepID=A0AAW0C1K8_9AGAR
MSSGFPKPMLCSLTEWSINHIRDVFEAPSDEEALRAIEQTFSLSVTATLNGSPLPREGIIKLVLSMRQGGRMGGGSGLRVNWKHTVEVPADPVTNRDGSFGGVYVITGLRKILPDFNRPVTFSRHKSVNVKIESQSPDTHLDSRRIVSLVFVASDVQDKP